jgi:SAM-dependent methyltransferase
MSDVIGYDDGPARRVCALGDTPEVRAQRRRVIELLAAQPGERILDVGCGPGHLAQELSDLVGTGYVRGVDVSEHMLALAAERGVDAVRSDGVALPFDSDSFDAAVATQVYEFVSDLPAALAELRRVVRSGGRVLVLDTDWDSIVWHSSDSARMERVLDGWRRRVADPRLPRTLARRLGEAGFEVTHREVYAIFDPRGDERSYSAHQIVHLGESATGVSANDLQGWAADLRSLASEGASFFSLNRYIFIATAR